MTRTPEILTELAELNSTLANDLSAGPFGGPFSVPEGYFEGLVSEIMMKIRAMEGVPTSLPAMLTTPLTVPNGYFESLDPMAAIRKTEARQEATSEEISEETFEVTHQAIHGASIPDPGILFNAGASTDAASELAALSPLLSSLGKQMPFSIPADYFSSLGPQLTAITHTKETGRVVSMGSRTWVRYAAAAVVTALVAISSLVYLNRGNDTGDHSAELANDGGLLKGVPTEQVDQLIKLADEEVIYANNTPDKSESREVDRLMQKVSDKEIQDFLNDAEAAESDADNDIILN